MLDTKLVNHETIAAALLKEVRKTSYNDAHVIAAAYLFATPIFTLFNRKLDEFNFANSSTNDWPLITYRFNNARHRLLLLNEFDTALLESLIKWYPEFKDLSLLFSADVPAGHASARDFWFRVNYRKVYKQSQLIATSCLDSLKIAWRPHTPSKWLIDLRLFSYVQSGADLHYALKSICNYRHNILDKNAYVEDIKDMVRRRSLKCQIPWRLIRNPDQHAIIP